MPDVIEAREAVASEADVREEVRRFYDSVGWQRVGPGVFQNARYEDLRPVSREYIQRCRRRVLRHLRSKGTYLVDAGSGPIQYPEYLEYAAGYTFRVCVDLSARALREARDRIGARGLFAVGDIAHLPFASEIADGIVSLHTIHHLPGGEQRHAFDELTRLLRPGASAVVVYGWGRGVPIEAWTRMPVRLASSLVRAYRRWRGRGAASGRDSGTSASSGPRGTYTFKHDYAWLMDNTRHLPGVEVLTWRSVGTNFLRTFIHQRLLGRWLLRLLYWVEERAPHFFGRFGQYPLIVIRRPPAGRNEG